MMNFQYLKNRYNNTSLTTKTLILTIFVGVTTWIIMDNVQNKYIRKFFFKELSEELEKQAKIDRLIFDHYIEMHNRSALLISSQQRFQSYIFSDNWLNRPKTEIKHHYRPPSWLPSPSVMRSFFCARYAILTDADGNVQEVYHHLPEDLPKTFLTPSNLMQKLSSNQSYMTKIEDFPYVLTTRFIEDEKENVVATLMLVSPLDNDFLIDAAQGILNSNVIITLLSKNKIIATNNPDLLPIGTAVETLENHYISTGLSHFDDGSFHLTDVQFASFVPVEKTLHFANHILMKVHQQRTIFAAIMLILFGSIVFSISRDIKKLTKQVTVFSKESLGIDFKYEGDEIAQITLSFLRLRGSILQTISRANAISKGNYVYELQQKIYDHDQLGQALSRMNNTLQNQATTLKAKQADLYQLNKAYERFVPREFLSLLNRSIVDVQLGDQVEKEMTILFSDIRGFTSLSEKMTPQETFNFINSYLSQMAPIINQHHGFIDKYIGDAIMALFPIYADDAVEAAITMLEKLKEYNEGRKRAGYLPIQIGIGLNTGKLMLGTVGDKNRMDGTVVSDAVNLASRIEEMTKDYKASLLISESTYSSLIHPDKYSVCTMDRVEVKGKSEPVTVYEILKR